LAKPVMLDSTQTDNQPLATCGIAMVRKSLSPAPVSSVRKRKLNGYLAGTDKRIMETSGRFSTSLIGSGRLYFPGFLGNEGEIVESTKWDLHPRRFSSSLKGRNLLLLRLPTKWTNSTTRVEPLFKQPRRHCSPSYTQHRSYTVL